MMALIYLSVAWMAGIYGASLVSAPLIVWCLLCVPALAVAWLWPRHAQVRLAALCALFVLLGGLRYTVAVPRIDEGHVATYNDLGAVTLVGRVAAEPDVRDEHTNLRLRAETLAVEGRDPVEVHGTVLVRAPRYPEQQYGDLLRVQGRLEPPPDLSGFDYPAYLARQKVYSVMNWARVTPEPGRGLQRSGPAQALLERLYERLLRVKACAQRAIAHILPEPSASLLTGILLGSKSTIPGDLWDALSITGTSHIVVISGFNLSIIAGLFSSLSVRLVGRRYAAWVTSAAILVYTLLVGTSAAVVRAAIMSAVMVWGQHFGRPYSSPNALFGTAMLMTAWNPHTLWDLGFLLSFAATAGLLLFAMPAERGFEALLARLLPRTWIEPAFGLLFEPLVLTFCCQLTTMPIVWFHAGRISLVTLLTNALVLPLQAQVMAWGAAATLGGLLWLPLGRVLGWGAWLFLMGTIVVVEWTARVPYAAIDVQPWSHAVSGVLLVVWYAAVGGGAWLAWRTPERRKQVKQAIGQALVQVTSGHQATKWLIGGLAIVAILVWLAVAALPDDRLQVSFLDVGEGDATLIRAPSGQYLLVNGGDSSAKLTSHLGRRLPFWQRRLELLVLTDELTELRGVVPVLDRYEVGQMLYATQPCRTAVCRELEARVAANEIATHEPVDGLNADLGGPTLRVLGAGIEGAVGESSAVLRLEYGKTCFLLAASATPQALQSLVERGIDLRCDVLQVDAQTVATDEGTAFMQSVYPALVVLVGNTGSESESVGLAAPVLSVGRGQSITLASDGRLYMLR